MTNDARKLLSIVVPVYNEQGNITPLYDEVARIMRRVEDRYDWELVFTDNCSKDATFSELVALAERDARVRVFRFSRNFGFQRSILTGYLKARGDAAVQIDCDLQDPPELILTFIQEWEAGSKVVYGVRKSRKEGFFITLLRQVFYRLIDFLSEDHLPHDAGDFRLVDRRVLDVLRQIDDSKPYLRGTLATLGFPQKGIAYDRAARERGESKFRMRDLFALAFDGILSHSTVPLRVATYTGLVVSVITFLAIVYYALARIFWGRDWPPGFATTTALILLSLSLNALFLGVIGEYVGRIYHQVRKRPLTIIEHTVDRAPPRHSDVNGLGAGERPGQAEPSTVL
ncbi:glycosyltransferase family 2 protein [Polyangium aurulentum]|uniref:glycosyltransferase family 2 protein n=1 Tax=Polyangium aurulentum TaxID=2567896 RepID=UPI0010ADCE58|nr:glycosyltransferase family 2 protein [Polyangium aurulentum]UQA60253.1 glycosyltransferase [Polyangium aurulentum]